MKILVNGIEKTASFISKCFNFVRDNTFNRKYAFIDEYDISKMLITNCIDNDIKNPVVLQLLQCKVDSQYKAVVNLFFAIQLISEIAADYEAEGFELEDRWMKQVSAANDRLLDSTVFYLSKKDRNKFNQDFGLLCRMVTEAFDTSNYEPLFAYEYVEPVV